MTPALRARAEELEALVREARERAAFMFAMSITPKAAELINRLASALEFEQNAYQGATRDLWRAVEEVGRLREVLGRLEVAANTVSYCYDKRPENFASALRELQADAALARLALQESK